jgi:hypothetical protein
VIAGCEGGGKAEQMALGDAISQASKSLAFLDDLNSYLAFPPIVACGSTPDLPALYELYATAPIIEDVPGRALIVSLARRLNAFEDPSESLEDRAYGKLARMIYRRKPQWWDSIADEAWKMDLQKRAMLYDYACLLNYGVSITTMLEKAQGGDEDALLRLVKIDKSILGSPWAAAYLEQRQYAADWAFFKRLSYWVAREPVDKGAVFAKELLIVALFWEEHFSRCTLEETVETLKPHCATLQNEMDYDNFRRKMNRAGLKKRRYNRQIGQMENDRTS